MQLTSIISKWTKVAGLFLIGGALAWTIKLSVIIATDGRIIDTGAAAFLMKLGILMLLVGSTGIGYRLSLHRSPWLRITAILLSPVVVSGAFLLFAKLASPLVNILVENSSMWYAEQESPIALAVIFFSSIGYLLYRSNKTVNSFTLHP